MNNFETNKIQQIIDSCGNSKTSDELIDVIFSLGRDAENEEEFLYSFDKLIFLCKHKSSQIRAMAILALSILAVYNNRLDRKIVEPIIKKEWHLAKLENNENLAIIRDAVDDINNALGWDLILDK